MVRQLLSFSRLGGRASGAVDLNDVIGGAQQLFERLLGPLVELRIVLGPDLWAVNADRTQIEQVLLNLIANARDAMRQGGRLTIETRNVAPDGMEAFGEQATGPHVVVSVADTGAGMDPATQARAFEPFFTTKGDGTGFGLATVRSVIEQAGGWVHLQSAPGQGTLVRFGIPASGDMAVVAAAADAPRGGGETVLLVEDEEGVRELVRDFLVLAGYRVLEASSPSQAERISAEFDASVHLLLTDVVMPEMSGIDLSSRLRAARPGLRAMYMSGFPAPEGSETMTGPEGQHFIAKPFDRQGLLRAVRDALDSARPL
jgi:CheY-like chemotaxis protein